MKPITLKAGAGCTPISMEHAIKLFGQDAINAGELRGEITTRGPWGMIASYRAIATTATWKPGPTFDYVDEFTIHGLRTMSARESGFDLEGHVSIDGKKRSCFTSSILFELPDGKLINVAVIHVRPAKEEG